MDSPWDVAFGRLAIQQGLVAADAVRLAFQQLPPGRSLAEELVRRRLLAPERAGQLDAWLRQRPEALRASSGAFPALAGAGAADPTLRLPPGASQPAADDGLTLRVPPPARPHGQSPADDGLTLRMPPPGQPAAGDGLAVGGPPPSAGSTDAGSAGGAGGGLPGPGDVVGGYVLEGLLGRGGMGAVFKGRDPRTGAEVALKVVLPGADPDGRALARFRREAEAVAKVDAHAGIVRVRGLGAHDGLCYAVMDLVRGRDLHAVVRAEGALPVERALRYAEAVARAVQHCHAQGVLHRDLKPANVLLREEDDAPLVMDFGLALDRDAQRLTRTGEVMGTPAYMSPEQAEGDKEGVDARTDVYALGAILFELAAGRPPFQGQQFEVIKQVFLDMPPLVGSLVPGAPPDLDVIIHKAMTKDKALRYATAAALADDVARLRRGEPIAARAPTRWQVLRWRWRRRDRRLLRAVSLGIVALTLPPAGWLLYSAARDRQQVQALARSAGALPGALPADPWPLADAPRGAVFDAAQQALSGAAQLQGADATRVTVTADRVLALREWLTEEQGYGRRVRAGLADPAATDRALLRLATRLRATHDAGPGCAPGAHPPWWAAQAASAPGGEAGQADDEARLFAVLRDLRWGCVDPAAPPLTLAQARQARQALESLREVPGAAGSVATAVLAAMARLERVVGDTLADGRKGLLQQLETTLARRDADARLSRPGEWQTPVPGGPLEAWLEPLRAEVELREAAALVAATAARIPDDVDWRDPRIYRALARLLAEATTLPAAEPAEIDRALDRQAAALVFQVGARANAAGVSAPEFAELAAIAAPMLTSLEPVVVDGERFTHHAAASCLAFSSFEQLQRGARPTPQLLAAAARFGFDPRMVNRQEDIELLLGLIEGAAARYPIGELFLMRQELRTQRRERGRGDRVGRDRRRSPEVVQQLVDDLATALGPRLAPETRAALTLPPVRPDLKPVLARRAAVALGTLAHLRLRLETTREAPPRRDVVEVCLRLVDTVRRGPGPLRGHERADLLEETAAELDRLVARLEQEAPGGEWARALRPLARELWEASLEAALAAAERATRETSAETVSQDLAGQLSAIQELDLDVERQLKRAVVLALHGLLRGLPPGDDGLARVVARYEEAARRIQAIHHDPPLELLHDWRVLEARRGGFERAEGLAAETIQRVDRTIDRLLDDDDRADARRQRGRARAFLAGRRLAAGDPEGARALRDAARADGDLEPADPADPWAGLTLD